MFHLTIWRPIHAGKAHLFSPLVPSECMAFHCLVAILLPYPKTLKVGGFARKVSSGLPRLLFGALNCQLSECTQTATKIKMHGWGPCVLYKLPPISPHARSTYASWRNKVDLWGDEKDSVSSDCRHQKDKVTKSNLFATRSKSFSMFYLQMVTPVWRMQQ